MTREKRNRLLNIVIGTALIVAILSLIGTVYMDNVRGNRLPSSMDTYQTFNTAYVLGDNGKWEPVVIKNWRPVGDSRIQIVDTNDVPIYTHFSNVKLTNQQ